jgi:thiol-disulfide isomerase/thioredoxin
MKKYKNIILVCLSLVLGILFCNLVRADDYAQVHINTYGNGKPMLVYIGSTQCPPCNAMKLGPLRIFKDSDLYSKFNYIELDSIEDRVLIERIGSITKIPHILLYNSQYRIDISVGYIDHPTLDSKLRANTQFWVPLRQPNK